MADRTRKELDPVDGYPVILTGMAYNEIDRGTMYSHKKDGALALAVYTHQEPPFYVVSWPTPLGITEAAGVFRSAETGFKPTDFTCIADGGGENGKGRWNDGDTLDEVLMLDDTHLLRADGEAKSLLWSRDIDYDSDQTYQRKDPHFSWFGTEAMNEGQIPEVIKNTILPDKIEEVDVALNAFNKIYEGFINGTIGQPVV